MDTARAWGHRVRTTTGRFVVEPDCIIDRGDNATRALALALFLCLLSLTSLLFLPSDVAAEPFATGQFTTPGPATKAPLDLLPKYLEFHHDNDVMFDSDRDYSSGLFLRIGNWGALRSAARGLTKLLLPASLSKRSLSAFGLTLGQAIYTPLDTLREDFLPRERPYAGWLFAGAHYQVVTPHWGLRLSLQLGLVGRWSFGQDVQQSWHALIRLVNKTTAKGAGWDFQLPTEFTIQAHVLWDFYLFQLQHRDTTWMRLHMTTELALGTPLIYPALRLYLAIGWLPQRHNAAEIPTFRTGQARGSQGRSVKQRQASALSTKGHGAARSWDFALFFEVFGRVVLRNLFLDGSTFVVSHQIERYPVVGGLEFGLDWRVNWFRMRFGIVVQSLDAPYALRAYHDHKYARLTLTYTVPAE